MTKGWYWVLVRGFWSSTYTWKEEWLVVEYDHQWRLDSDMLRRKGLYDITSVVKFVGPIERPEVME